MTTESFSTYDVAKLIGVSRSTVQQIVDRGVYVASIEEAEGKGTRNQFSREDVYRIAVILELNKLNIPQKKASEIVKNIDWSFPTKKKILYADDEAPAFLTKKEVDYKKPTTALFILKSSMMGKKAAFILAEQVAPGENISGKVGVSGSGNIILMDLGFGFKQQYDAAIENLKAQK